METSTVISEEWIRKKLNIAHENLGIYILINSTSILKKSLFNFIIKKKILNLFHCLDPTMKK